MARVVVCGLAGFSPVGGMGLHYLQFCLGLRDAGAEVFYLEDNGWWPASPSHVPAEDAPPYSARWVQEVFDAFDLPWAYMTPDGAYHGSSAAEAAGRCEQADLLLNISGGHEPTEHRRRPRVVAYVDTDPGFDTVPAAQGDAYRRDLFAAHDIRFTFAELMGRPECRLPDLGLEWRTTRQPLHLPFWAETPDDPGDRYTTIMNWSSTGGRTVEWQGERWGQKDAEFPVVRDLPRTTGLECELAVYAPKDVLRDLTSAGWRVVDPGPPTASIWAHRDYIASSRGELTVVKQAYARSVSGWFAERSACYLAAGRPVISQDTGWSWLLGSGDGLLAFTTTDQAHEALLEVEGDLPHHAARAREIAAQHFEGSRVMQRLLADAGVD